jgi:hypothetical protein
MKKRGFVTCLTTEFFSCDGHLQLHVFLHLELHQTSCMDTLDSYMELYIIGNM